jgi:hypothetical protein
MRFFLILLLVFNTALSYSQKYSGDGMLYVLGQVKDSSQIYKDFSEEWGFERKISLPEKGLRMSRNSETQRITVLFFAGKGYEVGDLKYQMFDGKMPFGITMNDDFAVLRDKLGPEKSGGEEFVNFNKNGVVIFAKFKNKSKSKLEYIKIGLSFGQIEYNPNQKKDELIYDVVTDDILKTVPDENNTKPTNETKVSEQTNRSNRDRVNIEDFKPSDLSSSSSSKPIVSSKKSPFYRALLTVLASGSETYFESIKAGALSSTSNFWSYKYTYPTTLKIPGESYNFIYSFPFQTSQKDFVSVLKEGNYDSSFKSVYDETLQKLKIDFQTTEGWRHSYPKDEDPNFPLKDFEVQNEKFGSVVLDYHKKPSGESVLYLRFLLYYD